MNMSLWFQSPSTIESNAPTYIFHFLDYLLETKTILYTRGLDERLK